MILYGYECPECRKYFKTIEAALRQDRVFVIRCPKCLSIERFKRQSEVAP